MRREGSHWFGVLGKWTAKYIDAERMGTGEAEFGRRREEGQGVVALGSSHGHDVEGGGSLWGSGVGLFARS